MNKLTVKSIFKIIRTILIFLLGIALQITCFLYGKNEVKDFNKQVTLYNESIQQLTWWERVILRKKNEPKKMEFDSSEWFAFDHLKDFDIKYYDWAELILFCILFIITASTYLYFSGNEVRKNHPMLRVFPFIFSLLSLYVILYEVVAICR